MSKFKRRLGIFNTYFQVYAIIGAFLITIVGHFVLYYRLQPKANETISIFIQRKEMNDRYNFRSLMINKVKSQGLRKLNVYDFNGDDADFYEHYTQYAKISEFIVLSKEHIEQLGSSAYSNFLPYNVYENMPFLQKVEPEEYLMSGNDKVGLCVFSKTIDNRYDFSKFATFKYESYLLINKNTVHYNSETNRLNSMADWFLRELLSSLLE